MNTKILQDSIEKEKKYYIYGQIAFVKQYTSGIAFHELKHGLKHEFQIEIENNKLKGLK